MRSEVWIFIVCGAPCVYLTDEKKGDSRKLIPFTCLSGLAMDVQNDDGKSVKSYKTKTIQEEKDSKTNEANKKRNVSEIIDLNKNFNVIAHNKIRMNSHMNKGEIHKNACNVSTQRVQELQKQITTFVTELKIPVDNPMVQQLIADLFQANQQMANTSNALANFSIKDVDLVEEEDNADKNAINSHNDNDAGLITPSISSSISSKKFINNSKTPSSSCL
jgi:hypothetical protein